MLLSRGTKFILSLLLTSCLLSGTVNAAPPKGPASPSQNAKVVKSLEGLRQGIPLPTSLGGTGLTSSGSYEQSLSVDSTGSVLWANKFNDNTYNCNFSTLSHTKAALARVRSRNGNGIFVFIGDSTTFGSWGGIGGINTGDLVTTSMPNKFAEVMNGFGLNTNPNGFMGAGVNEHRSVNDPRLTYGTGWIDSGSHATLGGNFIQQTSPQTAPLSFTPTINVDTFKVFYLTSDTSGVLKANIDGGTDTTVDTTGTTAGGFGSFTLTAGSVGAHTINISYYSGIKIYIEGIVAYDSTTKSLNVVTAAAPSGKVSDLISTSKGYSAYYLIPALNQDATFIQFGLNDLGGGVSAATYSSNMQTAITKAKTTGGDVILLPPNVNGSYTLANYNAYISALKTLAVSNNACFIDLSSRWGTYSTANNLGFMTNAVHPSGNGYADEALAIAGVIYK